ncbi:MAG: hypothetical protein HQ596_05355 [Candidatus Saganbacteria bacterium]|nr:hypothetical protein [Candidatus Saganbacteria bacterium]
MVANSSSLAGTFRRCLNWAKYIFRAENACHSGLPHVRRFDNKARPVASKLYPQVQIIERAPIKRADVVAAVSCKETQLGRPGLRELALVMEQGATWVVRDNLVEAVKFRVRFELSPAGRTAKRLANGRIFPTLDPLVTIDGELAAKKAYIGAARFMGQIGVTAKGQAVSQLQDTAEVVFELMPNEAKIEDFQITDFAYAVLESRLVDAGISCE